MSNFEVRYFELAQARSQLKQAGSALTDCAYRLRMQSTALSGQSGFGIDRLRSSLQTASQKTSSYSNQVAQLGNFLGEVESKTKSHENQAHQKLANVYPDQKRSYWEELSSTIGALVSVDFSRLPVNPAFLAILGPGGSFEDLANLTSVGASGSVEATWWDYEASGSYGLASGSVNASVGTAEAHASASAGLLKQDSDGNWIFSPEVSATAGASVCALTAGVQGRIGNDNINAYGNADVTVGKVGAEVTAKAGLYDDEGRINPTAKIDASAEAILVDASAAAGVTILGADAKVTGSVNVGLGAHANVGYEGGVLSFDIGASVGVGASVGFEVDIGGMADTLAGAAQSAWDNIKWW